MKSAHATIEAIALIVMLVLFPACKGKDKPRELASFPLNDLNGLLSTDGVELDREVSADNGGSLKIVATKSTTISLLSTGDLDVENARVTYSARVKTQGFRGKAYLEMWCRVPQEGEFFSKGLDRPLLDTADWTTLETHFFLKKGENPDNIILNLVVEGTGTVWIDEVELIAGPLE